MHPKQPETLRPCDPKRSRYAGCFRSFKKVLSCQAERNCGGAVCDQPAQRDARFFKERERERLVNAEKTKALRTLRLAKEAAEALEKAALPPTSKKGRS